MLPYLCGECGPQNNAMSALDSCADIGLYRKDRTRLFYRPVILLDAYRAIPAVAAFATELPRRLPAPPRLPPSMPPPSMLYSPCVRKCQSWCVTRVRGDTWPALISTNSHSPRAT